FRSYHRRPYRAGCQRERLPLRGAGAKRLRGVTAPKAYRRGSACAQGRWRAAAPGGGTPLRHAARATSPQGEAFRVQLMSRFTSFSKEGNSMKYIFITGGVVSGLGKGICAASLGRLLKQRGLRVRNQTFDPYLNVDPGTMSPYQHGEVFVTDDGAETDLDLGHYERF